MCMGHLWGLSSCRKTRYCVFLAGGRVALPMPDEPDKTAKTTDGAVKADDAGRSPALAAVASALSATLAASRKDAPKAVTPAADEPGCEPADSASEPAPDAKAAEGAPAPAATLFGALDADERIRQTTEQHERTLWAGAVAATLVYAALITGQAVTGFAALVPAEQLEQMRRGQDAPPDSISVELVPDPDRHAKTKHWSEGTNVPAPEPSEDPPQAASIAQPEIRDTHQNAKDEPRPEGAPMLLDIDSLVDAAAQDLKQKIDRHYDRKAQKKREQQAAISSGGMKVRGTGATGRSDAFTRSVIAALMKTRPGPFALWGRVLVSFQITEAGALKYVHLLQSSGNSALDKAALAAIRKARFEAPPPGLSPDARTYIIDYIFG